MAWWRRRKERLKQVTRDADNLVALFGDGAYSEALARARHEVRRSCNYPAPRNLQLTAFDNRRMMSAVVGCFRTI